MGRRNTLFSIAPNVAQTWLIYGTLVQRTLVAGEEFAQTAASFLTDYARQNKKQSIYGMG